MPMNFCNHQNYDINVYTLHIYNFVPIRSPMHIYSIAFQNLRGICVHVAMETSQCYINMMIEIVCVLTHCQ